MSRLHFAVFVPALALSSCAHIGANYEPILDGAPVPGYTFDLLDCQALARRQKHFDMETVGAALAGGVVGGVMGSDESGVSIVEGVIAGVLFGALGGAIESTQQRKGIVVRCMEGRGHPVVG